MVIQTEIDSGQAKCIADPCVAHSFVAICTDQGHHAETMCDEFIWKDCRIGFDFDHVDG